LQLRGADRLRRYAFDRNFQLGLFVRARPESRDILAGLSRRAGSKKSVARSCRPLIFSLRRDAFAKVALGPASSCRRVSRHFVAGPRIVTIDQPAVDTMEASVGVGVDGTPST